MAGDGLGNGRYRRLGEPGRGGMGVVRRACQAPPDRPVAVGLLSPSTTRQPRGDDSAAPAVLADVGMPRERRRVESRPREDCRPAPIASAVLDG